MVSEDVPFYADWTSNPLRGGQSRYRNIISTREMLTVTALCETFLPSLALPSSSKSVADFYRTSAVMTQTDQELGGLLSGRLKHRALGLIRLVLWLLSTWWGTLAICGTRSLSGKFPYVQNFPAVEQEERVKIVLSWSLSSFFLFRMLFKALKYTTMILFFAQANENNQNPSWKTMGYCGPDPKFFDPEKKTTTTTTEEDSFHGPLTDFVVDAVHEEEVLARAFTQMGFSTTASTDSTCFTVNCDAVVVGSGTGGSVVAGQLANAGHKVIVVEKGRYYSRRNLSLLEGPSMDQMYEGNGLLCTDDLSMIVLAGSTVGGGSTINWSASIRTPEHVLNEWCDEHELKLFGSNAFHHALDVVCDRMGVQGEVTDEGFNNAILRKGCEKLGYPVTTVGRNAPKDHSCGWCHLGCRDGTKMSVQETWLSDMVHSGNGVILQGCNVSRVLHRSKRGKSRNIAGGIVAEFGDKEKQRIVISSTVTVVAGGALNTPALLKRSGLNNPNIGKNLHLHPVVMAWGYFPEAGDLRNNKDKNSDSVIFPEKKSYEGGIITSMSTIDSSFKTSGYGAVIQTPALHPGVFSALMPWVSPLDFRHRMRKFSRTAHLFSLVRDRGSGSAPDYPNKLWYSLDPRDEENLQKGIERMLRVLVAAGAAEIGTHNCEGKVFDVKKGSKEELEEFVKEASGKRLRDLSTPLCSAHQMGSCRMGTEVSTSVVSPRCETWEVEGLFVADTSVFPTALGVNPMVTVQAISFCTAQSILEVLNRKKN